MSNKIYNKWITEPPKVILQDVLLPVVLQDVLVTIEGSNSVELTYVDYEMNGNDSHKMVHGPSERVLAYMYIPTIDISTEGWHGEYTDGEEPTKDDRYIVCVEINKYNRTSYELAEGQWRKDKFVGNRDIIGWREFPKPFKKR